MNPDLDLRVTYIGGPTALLEMGGVRLLTDPTFDPAGSEYRTSAYTLRKTQGPALDAGAVGYVDAVLLSHDHHFDNLDGAGRAFLPRARQVLTTAAGAARLGAHSIGLGPGQTVELTAASGRALRVTGTPGRHGPEGGDRGPVIGFALAFADRPGVVYVSGDTVWYDGVAEVARRLPIRVAVLFMGAARVAAVGPAHLTFSASDGIEFARAVPDVPIVPLHYEGWEHFSESRADIERAFAAAGLGHRLRWLEPGRATTLA